MKSIQMALNSAQEETHILQFSDPGFLGLAEAFIGVFGLTESTNHLLVEGILLPVSNLFAVLNNQFLF